MAEKFEAFMSEHGYPIDTTAAAVGNYNSWKETRNQMARFEQFEKWFTTETSFLNSEVRSAILAGVQTKQIFAGKRGTGIYSAHDVKLYDTIAEALRNHQPVTAGTYDQAGSTASGRGTAGEVVSKGLSGMHQYPILSVSTDTTGPGRRWAKVRNPWGHMARVYTPDLTRPNVLKAVQLDLRPGQTPPTTSFVKPQHEPSSVTALAQQGICWLEWSDFMKRFMEVQIGATMVRVPQFSEMADLTVMA
jgi:hypothetical protein